MVMLFRVRADVDGGIGDARIVTNLFLIFTASSLVLRLIQFLQAPRAMKRPIPKCIHGNFDLGLVLYQPPTNRCDGRALSMHRHTLDVARMKDLLVDNQRADFDLLPFPYNYQ
jgi:hypothetical protein